MKTNNSFGIILCNLNGSYPSDPRTWQFNLTFNSTMKETTIALYHVKCLIIEA